MEDRDSGLGRLYGTQVEISETFRYLVWSSQDRAWLQLINHIIDG